MNKRTGFLLFAAAMAATMVVGDMAVDGIAPGDNQIKHSNTSGVENSVFVISAGLIGFFLLRKANNG
jgi:hypothetical protein